MQRLRVDIPVESVQFMAEEIEHGRILPRMYAFTGIEGGLPEMIMESIETSKSADDLSADDDEFDIPTYFIRDILEVEGDDQVVKIIVSRAHEDFDDPAQPAVIDNGRLMNYAMGMELDKASVVVLRALFRGDGSAGLRVCAGSWDGAVQAEWDGGHYPLINITFPPEEFTKTWAILTEKLMRISTGFYADSDESHITGLSYAMRIVQGDLLRALYALTGGSIEDGWAPLVASRQFIEGSGTTGESNPELTGVQGDYSEYLIDRIHKAYASILPGEGPWWGDGDGESNDLETDSIFAQIMDFNELQDQLEEVDASDPHYVVPANDDPEVNGYIDPLRYTDQLPESFRLLLNHVQRENPEILELARWDFSRGPVLERAYREHGCFATRMAMLITVAAATLLFSQRDRGAKLLTILITILSEGGDPYPWELTAFTGQLLNYDTRGFSELLSVAAENIDDDDEPVLKSFYLVAALNQISNQVGEEGWGANNIDERLTQVSHFSDLPKVRSLLLCLTDTDDSEADSHTLAFNALRSYPREYLASVVPHTVNALAEYAAASSPIEAGSQEWRDTRYEYVTQMLTGMSFRLRRFSRTYRDGQQ